MTTTRDPELDTPTGVLDRARGLRAAADRAEADLLAAAVDWAALHAGDQVVTEADWLEAPVPVAGAGAPEVAEFCVAEFALAVGLSTDAGRRYLGQAVELFHRLPEVWARVQAGDLPAWRARRIAETTVSLSMPAAGFVDRQVAPVAHGSASRPWTGWSRRPGSGSTPRRPSTGPPRPPRPPRPPKPATPPSTYTPTARPAGPAPRT